jgi:CRISPR-associated endonuclease/helicase Cas3
MSYGNKDELIYNDFGIIDDSLREKLDIEFYKKYQEKYNIDIKNKKSDDFKDFSELQGKSSENLNHLRNKLIVEVKENLTNDNLFYIEAPTGSGKTNISIMCAIELLQKDKKINKIFYVFPFTTLITQNYDSIKNGLNLTNSQIIELHSRAKFNEKEERKDGIYGNEYEDYLANLFVNYPVTLISHVKFFDILTGVDKDSNYVFHRLANSIVILDEIQNYNPKYWSEMAYLFNLYAKNFNIKFIIMSATLPKIGKLLGVEDNFKELVINKDSYFQNPNFAKRVEIITDRIKIEKADDIWDEVIKKSKKYKKKNKKVHTIIEFITKKNADIFYQKAKKSEFFDEVLLLSGTIIEPRRKEVLEFVKKNQGKNILLVTTQVVEAGIDIDMDIGFKEVSLIDSDEQLAGRINRNCKKVDSKLFLFELNRPMVSFVYKKDLRREVRTKEDDEVLRTKEFDKFYKKVIERIKEINALKFVKNLSNYKNYLKNLYFKKAHLKIIEEESVSIYVPINKEAITVFNEYENLIKNKKIDTISKKIGLKKLASKLSQYTFSLVYDKKLESFLHTGYVEKRYGYWYLKEEHIGEEFDETIIYTYKDGLNTKVLKSEHVDLIF